MPTIRTFAVTVIAVSALHLTGCSGNTCYASNGARLHKAGYAPYLRPVSGRPGFYWYPDEVLMGAPLDCRGYPPGTLIASPQNDRWYCMPPIRRGHKSPRRNVRVAKIC